MVRNPVPIDISTVVDELRCNFFATGVDLAEVDGISWWRTTKRDVDLGPCYSIQQLYNFSITLFSEVDERSASQIIFYINIDTLALDPGNFPIRRYVGR